MAVQTEQVYPGQKEVAGDNTCHASSVARFAGQKVREVVEETSQKAHQVVGNVAAKFEAAELRAKETIARGRQAVGACETAFEDKIRAKPVKSLLIATAAGVVFGMTTVLLLRRRHKAAAVNGCQSIS